MLASLSDEALIRRAQDGSAEAYARLVATHQSAVRAFAARLSPQGDGDDLAQEAFVGAWRRLGDLKPGVSFRTFVCGFVFRKASNDRRSRSRQAMRDGQWQELRPDSSGAAPDRSRAVQAALNSLSVEQRACVSLCIGGDYTHSEAAEILGLPLGTVKTHILKGRERLNALLGVRS